MQLIAEVKTKSPFGFQSPYYWKELFDIANDIGDIISIHTDFRWGGSFKQLRFCRKLTKKPILAKGIHNTDEEIEQAFDCGANYCLVVGRIPQYNLPYCIIEPNDLSQLIEMAIIFPECKFCYNARDLIDGQRRRYYNIRSVKKQFPNLWLCQASFIKSLKDIDSEADAAIVGENLVEFAKEWKDNDSRTSIITRVK